MRARREKARASERRSCGGPRPGLAAAPSAPRRLRLVLSPRLCARAHAGSPSPHPAHRESPLAPCPACLTRARSSGRLSHHRPQCGVRTPRAPTHRPRRAAQCLACVAGRDRTALRPSVRSREGERAHRTRSRGRLLSVTLPPRLARRQSARGCTFGRTEPCRTGTHLGGRISHPGRCARAARASATRADAALVRLVPLAARSAPPFPSLRISNPRPAHHGSPVRLPPGSRPLPRPFLPFPADPTRASTPIASTSKTQTHTLCSQRRWQVPHRQEDRQRLRASFPRLPVLRSEPC